MPPSKPVDIPSFASTQLTLLSSELAAEIAETSELVGAHTPTALQRAGLALTNLVVNAQRTGYGGKTVLELGPDSATVIASSGNPPKGGYDGPELPEHGIRTGDIVLVSEQSAGSAKRREVRELEKKGAKGVVTRVGRGVVGVALDEDKGEENVVGAGGVGGSGRVWMVKLADDVTYRR
ncbi:hypothetical protein B0T09DRAFT_189534 [Sordaria sp. MPI-SDFR-AT-0083]|nr:hypothetical protein B0T09DRAFT_189534 [Sordaria sp. MPI-SDFR-AT-0083]